MVLAKLIVIVLAMFVIVGIGASGFVTIQSAAATLGQQQQSPTTITIAIQPTAQEVDIQAQGQQLEQFLEERTGYDIEFYVPLSWSGVVEALRFGHADVAMMTGWASYLAVNKANATLELAEVREVITNDTRTNATYYFSHWVTRPDSPANSLQDLRDMRAAFPSPRSASGYVMPMYALVNQSLVQVDPEEGVDPETFFSEVLFAGGYASAWEALRNGEVDVSIIAGDVSEDLYFEVLNNTKVIHEQGPIPSHGVVFSNEIDPSVKDNIKAALLEIGNDESSRQIMVDFVSLFRSNLAEDLPGADQNLSQAIFVGFQETTAEEHLGLLSRALNATGLAFTEEIS